MLIARGLFRDAGQGGGKIGVGVVGYGALIGIEELCETVPGSV